MDSIASAIGYAELKGRLDSANDYVPVRLGELNAQAQWALERAMAPEPALLDHVMLRARDVMRQDHPYANHNDSLREVGVAMAKANVDLIPIVDDDGVLVGILTARDLARRYIKESGEPSSFADRPASIDLIVEVLGGTLLVAPQRRLTGRLWAVTVDVGSDGRDHGAQRHRGDRQPGRRPAPGGRPRRRPGGVALRRRARRGRDRGAPARAGPAWCSRPSTPTSPAGWCRCRCRSAR